jgi:hypothetical protein
VPISEIVLVLVQGAPLGGLVVVEILVLPRKRHRVSMLSGGHSRGIVPLGHHPWPYVLKIFFRE